MPLFFVVGEVDDASGVILIGMTFIFVIAVFAAVLQKLLKEAIDIKSEKGTLIA